MLAKNASHLRLMPKLNGSDCCVSKPNVLGAKCASKYTRRSVLHLPKRHPPKTPEKLYAMRIRRVPHEFGEYRQACAWMAAQPLVQDGLAGVNQTVFDGVVRE
jgi:hypothetical protein